MVTDPSKAESSSTTFSPGRDPILSRCNASRRTKDGSSETVGCLTGAENQPLRRSSDAVSALTALSAVTALEVQLHGRGLQSDGPSYTARVVSVPKATPVSIVPRIEVIRASTTSMGYPFPDADSISILSTNSDLRSLDGPGSPGDFVSRYANTPGMNKVPAEAEDSSNSASVSPQVSGLQSPKTPAETASRATVPASMDNSEVASPQVPVSRDGHSDSSGTSTEVPFDAPEQLQVPLGPKAKRKQERRIAKKQVKMQKLANELRVQTSSVPAGSSAPMPETLQLPLGPKAKEMQDRKSRKKQARISKSMSDLETPTPGGPATSAPPAVGTPKVANAQVPGAPSTGAVPVLPSASSASAPTVPGIPMDSTGQLPLPEGTLEKLDKPGRMARKKAARKEAAKVRWNRDKGRVEKCIRGSRRIVLRKPVLAILLGRQLAGPVKDAIRTVASGGAVNPEEVVGGLPAPAPV